MQLMMAMLDSRYVQFINKYSVFMVCNLLTVVEPVNDVRITLYEENCNACILNCIAYLLFYSACRHLAEMPPSYFMAPRKVVKGRQHLWNADAQTS